MNRRPTLLAIATAPVLLAAHIVYADSSFDEQLARHFKAIQSRDLAALKSTLTSDAQLELILPTGKRMTTRQEFIAFHEEWFKSPTWRIRFEPLTRVETQEMAIATVRARYEDVENGGPFVRKNWLTLTFRKEQGHPVADGA